jgi:hypothetical protein
LLRRRLLLLKQRNRIQHKELKPNQAVVEEPANPTFKIQRVHAPTVPEEDAARVPVKHDFDHRFDVPPFAGKTTANIFTERRNRNKTKTIWYDKKTGKPLTKVVTRTCAVVNRIPVIRYLALRVTLIFANKNHALNT